MFERGAATFREDYEIYGAENGTVVVSYSGSCQKCGLRWMGAALGQTNGREETTRCVPRGSYSMGMVVGLQPDVAQDLLADGGPGTPQRFLWLSAYDPAMPDDGDADELVEPRPFRLPLCNGRGSPVTGTITCPEWLRRKLRKELADRKRGLVAVDELDSHVAMMRCKLAALLAVLDGRTRANDDDWELGGMVWDTSCKVRDFMVAQGRRKATEERERRIADTVEVEERVHLARVGATSKVVRLAGKLGRLVHTDGPTTRGAFSRKQDSPDRAAVPAAVDYAIEQGWIVPDGKALLPGPSRPA